MIVLSTIFGINGTGKDTIAREMLKRTDKLSFVSASRIMMFLLGITDGYDTDTAVSDRHYRQLNMVDSKQMYVVEQEGYRNFLQDLSKRQGHTVLLGHLVVVQFMADRLEYMTNDHKPDWFIKSNDWLIQLRVPAIEILRRRELGKEQRTRPLSIHQIGEHQELCDIEWCRISNSPAKPKCGMRSVDNISLDTAVAEISNLLL